MFYACCYVALIIMSKIDRLIQKVIDKLEKEGKRTYDSNILIKLRELSDGEVIDIVNAT